MSCPTGVIGVLIARVVAVIVLQTYFVAASYRFAKRVMIILIIDFADIAHDVEMLLRASQTYQESKTPSQSCNI